MLIVGAVALVLSAVVSGVDPATAKQEEVAIRKGIDAYVAAYHKGDIATLAGMWASQGEYIDPDSGKRTRGRANIQKLFEQVVPKGGAPLEIHVDSIRLIRADVAVEDGVATVYSPHGSAPHRTAYSAIHVKEDGKWKIDSVRESDLVDNETTAAPLAELEWLIGDWVNEGPAHVLRSNCHWLADGKYMLRTFDISQPAVRSHGVQIIGYNPISGKIRSWVFDSDGGYAEGTWSRKDDSWTISQKGYRADGKLATLVTVVKQVDNDHFTVQSLSRELDGQVLPNIAPMKVVRAGADKATP